MSKAKYIAGAGIVAAGAALSGIPQNSTVNAEQPANGLDSVKKAKEITISAQPSAMETAELAAVKNISKRTPLKVYHRFEEIPEITDAEAPLYNRNEYTYIVNADTYQKTGKIELKRVLTQEVTKANALSLIYRSECQTYVPKENEDQLAKYVIDLRIMSKTGITKGPSQMDDNAIKAFMKYLAADPESRQYVLPLMKSSNGTAAEAAAELEKKFFDENGKLRPMDEREAVLHGTAYNAIELKDNAWQTVASPALKKFIIDEEIRMSKKKANKSKKKVNKRKKKANMGKKTERLVTLSSTTKNYLCLTELFPSEDLLKKKIEDYNLAFYQLGRPGKTKHVTAALARSLNLKDEHGNLDATRIPTFAIAAAISSINWKGNGKKALKDAQNLRPALQENPEKEKQILRNTVKNWVTGKSKRYGVDEISQLNIITPEIIHQYRELELSGARRFAEDYQKAVEIAESKMRIAQRQTELADSIQNAQKTAVKPSKQSLGDELLQKGRTLLLTASDFFRGRS